MSVDQGIFYALALFAIVGATCAGVLARSLLASAIGMLLSMLSLAGIYALLEAHFLAALQLCIYSGLVAVIAILSFWLGDREAFFGPPRSSQANRGVIGGTAVALLAGLIVTQLPSLAPPGTPPDGFGGFAALGSLLTRDFVLPFSLGGFLLLAAIVGSGLVARRGAGE